MVKKASLNTEDRNFFSLVVKSIYMNPFGDGTDLRHVHK